MTRFHRRKKGQALVEFAFLLPFFLIVVIGGIIDFGWAFYNLTLLQQLTNDCAQYGAEGNKAVGLSQGEIIAYATLRKPSFWTNQLTVITDPTVVSGGTTKILRVRVDYSIDPLTPLYQFLVQKFTSVQKIPLACVASYKIPDYVYIR